MNARRESSGRTGPDRNVGRRATLGMALCVLGLLSAAFGAFFLHIVLESLGVVLGAIGSALGAFKLGIATIILSTVLLAFFLAVRQGLIPGL